MSKPVVVCVILLVLFSGQPTFTQSDKGTGVLVRVSGCLDNGSTQVTQKHIPDLALYTKLSDALTDFHLGRQKRALIGLGRFVMTILLKGARLVKSSPYVQYYIKPGGYKTALDDFDSVIPVNSRSKPHPLKKGVDMKTGQIGDKDLNVIPGDNNTPPSMTVKSSSGKTKIIYYGNYADVMNYMVKRKIFQ